MNYLTLALKLLLSYWALLRHFAVFHFPYRFNCVSIFIIHLELVSFLAGPVVTVGCVQCWRGLVFLLVLFVLSLSVPSLKVNITLAALMAGDSPSSP